MADWTVRDVFVAKQRLKWSLFVASSLCHQSKVLLAVLPNYSGELQSVIRKLTAQMEATEKQIQAMSLQLDWAIKQANAVSKVECSRTHCGVCSFRLI